MTFSAVILAGGESRRMGRDKAWLDVDGRPLLARQIDLLQSLAPAELFISGRVNTDYSDFNCPVLHDRMPGNGPLGGIATALEAATGDHLLVLAVDMPAMTPSVLDRMLHQCTSARGVIPRLPAGIEPLAAVYPRTTLPLALDLLTEKKRSARNFARLAEQTGRVAFIDIPPAEFRHFANWNTVSPGIPKPTKR